MSFLNQIGDLKMTPVSKLKTILKAHKTNEISIKEFNIKERFIKLDPIGNWNFALYLEDTLEQIKDDITSYKAHKQFYANLNRGEI